MKQILISIIVSTMISCEKDNNNNHDDYLLYGMNQGSINFLDMNYFSQIAFENNSYEEYASCEAVYQKLPAINTL